MMLPSPQFRSVLNRVQFCTILFLLLVAILGQGAAADGVPPTSTGEAPSPIGGPGVKGLDLEPIGTFAARAWYQLLTAGLAARDGIPLSL